MQAVLERCPIQRYAGKLRAAGELDDAVLARIEDEAGQQVAEAMAFADASPYPEPAEALSDVV